MYHWIKDRNESEELKLKLQQAQMQLVSAHWFVCAQCFPQTTKHLQLQVQSLTLAQVWRRCCFSFSFFTEHQHQKTPLRTFLLQLHQVTQILREVPEERVRGVRGVREGEGGG